MTDMISFFESMPSYQKLIWIVLWISIFWLAEGIYPLIRISYKKWRHARLNFLLLATTILINLLVGYTAVWVFEWTFDHNFGLLQWLDISVWIELLIAVMLLDFIAQYVVHYLLHRIRFLWRFHMVHHSDTHVDVTTGTRHHPGDFIFRETFALIAIFIGGIPFGFYIIYRLLTIFFTYFSHANIKLPHKIDLVLSWIFITPKLHKFHHHFERPWTDTNFGNIFSFWDRLFGTLVYDNADDVVYGLDVLEGDKSEDIKYQLILPFDTSIKTD